MPLADFICSSCGEVREVYFPTYAHMVREAPSEKCEKCACPMVRMAAKVVAHTNGPVSGYEKENRGHLTVGKAADMRFGGKWV